jgi:Ca-activated chloride channel homolog
VYPALVKASYALSKPTIQTGETTRLSLVMRFGAEPAAATARRRLNLGLVLDRSGSMAGTPLKQAIRAAQTLVAELADDDRVSVVIYDDSADTIVPPELAKDKARIQGLIGKVSAGGCTNLSGGWLEGVKHVARHGSKETVNRVLLLTDGQANMGIQDPAVLIKTARDKAAEGVVTTTLGFGTGFNEDLLIGMARAAEGNFYFIQSPEDVAQVFKIELEGLSSVVGQNLVVTVRPDAVVEHGWMLNNYRTEERDKDIDVMLGDVYSVEDRVLVMELLVKPGAEGTVKVATVAYSFQTVVDGSIKDVKGELTVTVESASAERAAAVAPDLAVVGDASRLQTARTKDEAVVLADKGDLKAAAQKLRAMADELKNGPLAGQFEFAEEVDQLQHFAERLEQKSYGGDVRKELRDQSYQAGTRLRGDLSQRGTTGGSADGLPTVTSAEGGVVLRCERQGGKLRVHVVSDGYDAAKNVQFPRAVREEGVSYLVGKVVPSADGGFYRVEGAIRRLLRPGEQVKPKSAPSSAAAPAKPAKIAATAAGLPTTTEVGTGVIVQCVQEGSKLRARVVSDGYDPNWNIRFPRSIRELGVLYVCEQVNAAVTNLCGKGSEPQLAAPFEDVDANARGDLVVGRSVALATALDELPEDRLGVGICPRPPVELLGIGDRRFRWFEAERLVQGALIGEKPCLHHFDRDAERRLVSERLAILLGERPPGAELCEPRAAVRAIPIDHDGHRGASARRGLLDGEEDLAREAGDLLALRVHARQHRALDLPVLDVAPELLLEQTPDQHTHRAAAPITLVAPRVSAPRGSDVEHALADEQEPHRKISAMRRSSPTLNHISPRLKPESRRRRTPGSESSGATTVSPFALRPKTRTLSGGTKSRKYGECVAVMICTALAPRAGSVSPFRYSAMRWSWRGWMPFSGSSISRTEGGSTAWTSVR